MAADPLRARAGLRAATAPGLTLRALALALVLGLHGWFAWLLFAPGASPSTAALPRPERAAAREPAPIPERQAVRGGTRDGRAAPFEPGAPAAAFDTPAERAAYERGVAYELARREAIARHHDRTYGEELGAIMRLPLPNAWRALEALAARGDDTAADALLALGACAAEIPGRGETYRRLRDSAVEGLAAEDAAFVHGALDAELLGIESDARTCKAAGLDRARLVELAERRLHALGRGEAPPRGDDAHAWLEYFRRAFTPVEGAAFATEPGPEARAWMERLDASLDAAQWQRFQREAPADPVLAMRVAYCAMARCPDLPAEAWTDADAWIDRAAAYGFPQAISDVVDRRAQGGALADAHAWAEFGMWAIASGCFPIAQSIEYAQLARQRAAIAARLSPAQRAEARHRLATMMQSHGNAALEAQGCRP
ncbi:MAG TPA: hypothetical protein VFO79_10785 [Xanthomonadales bacterium]|nr:hypothetical protein [Xanthomonadales bacterium]